MLESTLDCMFYQSKKWAIIYRKYSQYLRAQPLARTCAYMQHPIPEPKPLDFHLTLPLLSFSLAVTGFIGKTPSWGKNYDAAIHGSQSPEIYPKSRILNAQTEVLDVPAVSW